MTFLYPIIWWSIISPPFLQNEAEENIVKGSKSRESAKEAAYIYCQNFINYYFSIVEVNFGK
jgi:hypothetical protein